MNNNGLPNNNIVTDVISFFTSNTGKSLEKLALYVAGVLQATGVYTISHVNPNVSLASIAAVLLGLHISTPAPKK